MQLLGITALVVDDHRDTLELAGMVLEWDGASVLEAKSAEEALKLLDRNVIDVVVCDIYLPRQDGRAFVRELRKRADDKRSIPALAVSGDNDPERVQMALAAGFDRFQPKPLDTDILVAQVRSLVGRE
ncbi:MAG: response regulator [Myxococcota bacterium]|nr:response regulator [Myxococcota bacterium]